MPSHKHEGDGLTEEEVAAILSSEEGRKVSVFEVRAVTARALRKLRLTMAAHGLLPEELF